MTTLSANAYYAHVAGPAYTCPNSELTYRYSTNMPEGRVRWTITNGKIFNIFSQTWESEWEFSQTSNPNLNETYPFRVKFDNLPLGTIGDVKVKVTTLWSVSGNKNVLFGPSPGTPIISGPVTLLNCLNEQQNYTAINLPENWQLTGWTLSSNIQQVGTSISPITVKGLNATYSGAQTLTGQFQFVTNGNVCALQSVNKSIWLGKPAPGSQVLDGGPYYSGAQICPGNHWVGMTWNGLVTSTAWTVTPGLYYSTNNTECNFTLPSSGFSGVSVSVNATNACGTSYNASYFLTKKNYGCGSFMVISYPNPAKEVLNIQSVLVHNEFVEETEVVPDAITLFDLSNKRIVDYLPNLSTSKIGLETIPSGEYVLHVKFGKEVVKKHISVKK